MSHRRPRRPVHRSARKFALERLEPRVMLTTLVGGDVFDFASPGASQGSGQDTNPPIIRISLHGNIQADFIGARVNESNQLILTDLPGRFVSSDVGRSGTEYLGGVGGIDGSIPVSLNQSTGAPMIYDNFRQRGNALAFQAIASNSNGATWGFNVTTPASTTSATGRVWLTQLDNTTGEGSNVTELTSLLPDNPGTPGSGTVMGVTAAAFDPNDPNTLYFVVVFDQELGGGGGGGGGGTTTTHISTPELFKLDVTNPTGTVTAIPGTFGVTSADTARYPTALAFDPNTNELIAFMASGTYVPPNAATTTGNTGGGTGNTTTAGSLITVSLANTDASGGDLAVRLVGTGTTGDNTQNNVNNITGLAFIPNDSELDPTRYILAVQKSGSAASSSGDTTNASTNFSQLLRIDRQTGVAITWGGTIDNNGPSFNGSRAGGDVQDLSYNSTLIDPFTGLQGALLGSDATTDDLLFIDFRQRPSNSYLYQINVIYSDADSYITIAQLSTDPDQPRYTTPFTGQNSLRVSNLQTGQNDPPFTMDANTGTVFIGAQTVNTNTGDSKNDFIPLTNGNLGTPIGSTLTGPMDAGLVVGSTLMNFASANPDLSQRLLGANLNSIQALAAGPNDRIAVIDSDRVDASGVGAPVDELALVNPVSGVAYVGGGVYDKNTGKQLSGVKAMAYGDLNGDGTLELYAIYRVNGVLTLGTISEDTTPPANPGDLYNFGAFTTIAALGAPIDTNDVSAMAFTPDGQTLYIVDGQSNLLQVNPSTGTVIANIGQIKDDTNTTLAIKSMDFGADGTLYAQDATKFRLVDINLTTALAGGVSATPTGSLSRTVGAIAFDPGSDFLGHPRDRFIAVDNAWASNPQQSVGHPSRGAALMVLNGTTADDMSAQNIGKFMVGGTLTGRVDISGSIGTFYAGTLLTGNVRGINPSQTTTPNFIVGGDINQLVTKGSIGTINTQDYAIEYLSGFNMQVGGVVGAIHAGDTFAGTVEAQLNLDAPGFNHYQYEVESSVTIDGMADPAQAAFQFGELNDPTLYNDTFDTPQYLAGTVSDPFGPFNITLIGSIDNLVHSDFADYYAVALMGGQTVGVQLQGGYGSGLNVGVFDPDGRLIATDYDNTSPQSVNGQEFQFTAQRPGVYRFAVAPTGDVNFNGNAASSTNGSLPTGQSLALVTGYQLNIFNAGALGLGAVSAGTNIVNPKTLLKAGTISSFHTSGSDFHVEHGDLGAIVAGGDYYSQTNRSIAVDQGNLRALIATNIGNGGVSFIPSGTDAGASLFGEASDPFLYVPNGSVGLLKTTGNLMAINTGFSTSNSSVIPVGSDGLAMAIGGFYQEIDAANNLSSNFVANSGFGNIRAGYLAGGSFTANADAIGMDGIIDLIDTSTIDGTAIYTGPGGNVRYLRADTVIRDPFFGGDAPDEATDYQAGQVVRLQDDSGTAITITPQITGNNPLYNPNDPFTTGPYTGTAITGLITYGIRGSGGSALVTFTASGSFNMRAEGNAPNSSAEVGTINVSGANGTPVVVDSSGNPTFSGTAMPPGAPTQNPNTVTQGLNIGFSGSGQVDVLGIDAGNLNVNNINSNGELPSVVAGTIGGLAAKRLGVAIGHFGVDVDPRQILAGTITSDNGTGTGGGTTTTTSAMANVYPFNQQHIGIQSGNIIAVTSRESIGNIMVNGTIGSITANADGSDNPAVFEGIVGPIVANGGGITTGSGTDQTGSNQTTTTTAIAGPNGGLVYTSGSINNVQIGEGIRSAGGGDVSFGGIYAQNHIGTVRNQGAGSDIRGAVVAGARIDSVVLNNGSLIGGQVLQIMPTGTDYSTARQGPYSTVSQRLPSPVNHVTRTIGEVRLPGNGGIIGSRIIGADIGKVTAPGFGILGSFFGIVVNGTMEDLVAGGYGIRAVTVYGGTSTGRLIANGDGSQIGTNAFEASVRQSEVGMTFDPQSGLLIGPMNDINAFLGTSAATPIIPGITDTGVIENVTALGSREFAGSRSWQIRGNTTYNFANSIGSIVTTSTVTGLNVTTGKLGTFAPASDVFNSTLVIAGPVQSIRINGSLTGNSTIYASGPNGRINNVTIANDLVGNVWATQRIGNISVGRNIAGTVSSGGNGRTGGSIGSLFFGGTIANGSLRIYGDVGTLTSGGSFGQSGDLLEVFGSIKKLQVRGDLRSSVHVTDTAQTIDVWGSILSGVTVGVDNTIGALLVGGDTQAGSIIRTRLLKRVKVGGANLATYQIG